MASIVIGPVPITAAELQQILSQGDFATVTAATPSLYSVSIGIYALTVQGFSFTYDEFSDLVSGVITDFSFTKSGTPFFQVSGGAISVDEAINALATGLPALMSVFGRGNDSIVVTAPGTSGLNLIGGTGDDVVNAGTANSVTFVEGAGNDTYIVASSSTVFSFLPSQTLFFEGVMIVNEQQSGIDTLQIGANGSIASWSYIENLILTGTSHFSATGNSASNQITGNTGNNRIDGGLGADLLRGGRGDDTYVVDSSDTVEENAGEGVDSIESAVAFVIPAHVESITLTGSSNINATGNALNNVMTGNQGVNLLAGGLGNDRYVLQNSGDSVQEAPNQGTDTVDSSVTMTLAANVENLVLTGAGTINGTGNELANELTGNSGVNVLTGLAGDDRYLIQTVGDRVVEAVGGGTDTLITPFALNGSGIAIGTAATLDLGALNLENVILTGSLNINLLGSAGPNSLVGNAGTNVLTGAGGNDTYTIQSGADSIVESPGQGTDTVRAGFALNVASYANVENATLLGGGHFNAAGDGGPNVLMGNRGNNVLTGAGGDDTLIGGPGFDTASYSGPQASYTVSRTGATVTVSGAEGTDAFSGFERITFADGTRTLPVVGRAAGTDLNGDGKGDLIWRNESGQVVSWLVDGITVPGAADFGLAAPIEWRVVAVKDLSGDGKADLVWRNDNGTVAVWLLNGTMVAGGAGLGSPMDTSWRIEALADLNADNKSDLLWRKDDGTVQAWLLDGLTVSSQTNLPYAATSDWSLAGLADVNADGKADALWRNDAGQVSIWLLDGTSVVGTTQLSPVLGEEWTIAAVADFNSDAKSDLLWRRDDGRIDVWLLDGTNTPTIGTLQYLAPAGWNLEVIDDLSGDGKADLFWRHDSGPIAIWLVDGTTVANGAGFPYQAPLGWNVTAVTDFSGDGRKDVLWRHDSGPVVAWFVDGVNFAGGGQLPYGAPTEWLAT